MEVIERMSKVKIVFAGDVNDLDIVRKVVNMDHEDYQKFKKLYDYLQTSQLKYDKPVPRYIVDFVCSKLKELDNGLECDDYGNLFEYDSFVNLLIEYEVIPGLCINDLDAHTIWIEDVIVSSETEDTKQHLHLSKDKRWARIRLG
jgi:hypothetical protein